MRKHEIDVGTFDPMGLNACFCPHCVDHILTCGLKDTHEPFPEQLQLLKWSMGVSNPLDELVLVLGVHVV